MSGDADRRARYWKNKLWPPYGSEGCECRQWSAGNWDSTQCKIHRATVVEPSRAQFVEWLKEHPANLVHRCPVDGKHFMGWGSCDLDEAWQAGRSSLDGKWTDALSAYDTGGILPYYKLPDGSVDAVKTVDSLMEMHGVKKLGPGERSEIGGK